MKLPPDTPQDEAVAIANAFGSRLEELLVVNGGGLIAYDQARSMVCAAANAERAIVRMTRPAPALVSPRLRLVAAE